MTDDIAAYRFSGVSRYLMPPLNSHPLDTICYDEFMAGQSSFTKELGDAICERLITGDMSLREVAREVGIPHSTILLWALKEKDFADQYARACEVRDDAAFERLEDLAAEFPERVEMRVGEDAFKTEVDKGWVQWKRNQIDTLKWSLAKRRPKKYGDKVAVEHSVDESLSQRLKNARARRNQNSSK